MLWNNLGLRVWHSQVAAMLPNIWAASVAVFSQDLSAPDQVLSFGVEWAGSGWSHWEMNHCMLLQHMAATACLDHPQVSLHS